MRDEATSGTPYGTRWRRSAVVLLPAMLAAGFVGAGIVRGVLAANFTVGSQPLDLNVRSVNAQGLGIVMVTTDMRYPDGGTGVEPVVKAALGNAEIDGLCGIVQQSLFGQTVSLQIVAAAGGVGQGSGIEFLVTELSAGQTELTNATLGRSADEVSVAGQSLGGQPGGFGLDVSNGTAVLNDLKAKAVGASILGALKAPDFAASLHRGDVAC
ncbi:DUF6230 family protein [Skermania piniformis]|uniref:Cholesterol esterase n=1 Tax=Skermania pinensis TaxID=39122 RepID=A0ABX8S7V9_9ACTN|nr:DUF6230 family protein [Skermania piniformis]QXQ13099.1 hypothetical protein KV203_14535 [Skermania piniformis]